MAGHFRPATRSKAGHSKARRRTTSVGSWGQVRSTATAVFKLWIVNTRHSLLAIGSAVAALDECVQYMKEGQLLTLNYEEIS